MNKVWKDISFESGLYFLRLELDMPVIPNTSWSAQLGDLNEIMEDAVEEALSSYNGACGGNFCQS